VVGEVVTAGHLPDITQVAAQVVPVVLVVLSQVAEEAEQALIASQIPLLMVALAALVLLEAHTAWLFGD
jgi:hypothetical protein